ncbi:MAG: hypothetical protein PUB93_02095 [Firmicutes bacterium]|nr:hypothetical protein [Bacillota bacterium]
MEQQVNETPVRRPRRRRKTKAEIFREAYLPYIILMAAAVLIVIFLLGAALRGCGAESEAPAAAAAVGAWVTV